MNKWALLLLMMLTAAHARMPRLPTRVRPAVADEPRPVEPPPDGCGSRTAYATLVSSDDFVVAAQVLAYSLRRVDAGYPLVALVTDGVSAGGRANLTASGCCLAHVPYITNPYAADPHTNPFFERVMPKLHLWNTTAYDTLVYIDADAIVVDNTDELAHRPANSAAPDMMPPDVFNSGVMVIQPDADEFATMMAELPSTLSYDGGDQGFLNVRWSDWFNDPSPRRLPFDYNALVWMAYLYPAAWTEMLRRVRIVHYAGATKPFRPTRFSPPREVCRTFVDWYRLYDEMPGPKRDVPTVCITDHEREAGTATILESVHERLVAAAARSGPFGTHTKRAVVSEMTAQVKPGVRPSTWAVRPT